MQALEPLRVVGTLEIGVAQQVGQSGVLEVEELVERDRLQVGWQGGVVQDGEPVGGVAVAQVGLRDAGRRGEAEGRVADDVAFEDVHLLGNFVRDNYHGFPFTCDDYDELLELMRHDKKSHDGEISCSLLTSIGECLIDQSVTADDVTAALDILRDLLGI